MGTIRIEFTPVEQYNLGLLRVAHLQLVFQDETSFIDRQDHWYVLEGIKDGNLLTATLGVQGHEFYTPLAAANAASGDALVDKIGTPDSRGSRVIVQNPQALTLWDAMSNYGAELDSQAHPYTGVSWPYGPTPTISSSSAVASMLWSIGIDINLFMPLGMGISPGTSTLLGTTHADEITLEGNFNQVAGGFGEDVLKGSSTSHGVEKFYGGNDDDRIVWSHGENIVQGGEIRLSYALDGLDTIDYSGVGQVTFYGGRHPVEHKSPNFITVFETGSDQLFSIEKVTWLKGRDIVTVREGIDILEVPIEFNLDDAPDGGIGDELIFTDSDTPLIFNVVDDNIISVQTQQNDGLDAGIWAQSVESIIGSAGDDLIYAGSSVTVADGGRGDDLLDGRLSAPFTDNSPLGYDIELYGNDGNDTIISGAGDTLAHGGGGSDRFVLSSMRTGDSTPDFVILDASSSDKLYVPHNFFKLERGGYEGSDLFQITGAPFKIDEYNPVPHFDWGIPDNNISDGFIEFVGRISFEMDGSDLLIRLFQGHNETYIVDYGPGEPPGPEITAIVVENETRTRIRVVDWEEGDLGITFPLTFDFNTFAENQGEIERYPGWESAVQEATNGSRFISALDGRPEAHLPAELAQSSVSARAVAFAGAEATEGDDVISKDAWSRDQIFGFGGNDNITGSTGGDVIDGGTGNDIMAGGRGNDTYFVDTSGDLVTETFREGFDKVYSAISYSLGDNIEHLTLTGSALNGHGNNLRNTITGNALNNVLSGGEGDDTLAGNEGDDELSGGSGSDGYVYENGDGNDVIIDAPSGTDQDVIVLAGNYLSSDVRFFRDPTALNDLILRFAGGGSITVRDHFNGSQIESIEFLTGEVWTTADVEERASAAIETSNDIPDALPDSYIYAGSGSFTVDKTALLENDRDSDGDVLQIVSVTDISAGSATIDANGNILIAPGSGATAINFRYWVSDGQGGTSSAIAEIALFPNQPPQITSAQLAPVTEDLAAAGRVFASDPNGDELVYRIKTGAGPQLGTIIFGEDGHFLYRPDSNANGPDSFTIEVSDALSGTAEYTFSPVIVARNDNPLARADMLGSVKGGTTKVITAASLLGNDSDIDGDQLRVSAVSGAVGGTVRLAANGDVRFVAANNYAGSGSFTYTISDGHGGTDQATASLTVIKNTTTNPHVLVGTNEKDTLTGTNQADTFYGKLGDDVLNGRGGNDVFHVRGLAGLDVFNGGDGYDKIRGGNSNDTIRVSADQANLNSIETIDGGAGNGDIIVATGGNDTLDFSGIAISGIEQIRLGAGNDIVLGSNGNDTFWGGTGQDTFRFQAFSGHDVILDFGIGFLGTGGDKIDLRETPISTYADLIENMRQSGNDTVIILDGQSSVTLKNVPSWQLFFEHFLV